MRSAPRFDLVSLQPFAQDRLEGREITLFVEDRGPQVSAVEGVVESARFVSSCWSWHAFSLPLLGDQEKRPDPIMFGTGFDSQ